MNDLDIRKVLMRELLDKHANDSETMIIEELGLKHGRSRIDLAVINDCMHGYEIKSDRDTLKRLPEQIQIYSSIMDRVTLVVGYRHAYNALKMIPEWWGVKFAEQNNKNGNVVLSEARTPGNNPNIDLITVVSLLWRNEALDILEKIGQAKGLGSKARIDIYHRLIEVVESESLRASVRQCLRSRRGWLSDVQQTSYGD